MERSPAVVEYVDGPWGGTTEERSVLVETIAAPDGRYVRSLRCADDGAMRYVWRSSELAEQDHQTRMKESCDGGLEAEPR
jgi:hypothetical protein